MTDGGWPVPMTRHTIGKERPATLSSVYEFSRMCR